LNGAGRGFDSAWSGCAELFFYRCAVNAAVGSLWKLRNELNVLGPFVARDAFGYESR
jgi:hypothetical protein